MEYFSGSFYDGNYILMSAVGRVMTVHLEEKNTLQCLQIRERFRGVVVIT